MMYNQRILAHPQAGKLKIVIWLKNLLALNTQ
jgi:hypothetical protein